MKKITLIILVLTTSIAFSFENQVKFEEREIKTEIKSGTPCADEYRINMLDLQESFCATYEQADAIATRIFEKCLTDTYGPN